MLMNVSKRNTLLFAAAIVAFAVFAALMIFGFVFTALTVGGAVKLFGRKTAVYALSMTAGIGLCYLFGTVWFVIWSANHSTGTTFAAALSTCVLPFIVPDLIKIALATLFCRRLSGHVKS